jgi:hypothetical protein
VSAAMTVFVPQNLGELDSLSIRLSKSGLIPESLRNKPADVAVVLMTGLELGLSPMQSLRSIHVVKGKPVLSADLMAALVMRSPECEHLTMLASSDEACVYETRRRGSEKPITVSYTIAQAQTAGLTTRDNWRAYPAAMLRARCVASICRTAYPDLVAGVYEHDEGEEIRATEHCRVVDATCSVSVTHQGATACATDCATSGVAEPVTLDRDWDMAARELADLAAQAKCNADLDALKTQWRQLPKTHQDRITPVLKARRAELRAQARPAPKNAATVKSEALRATLGRWLVWSVPCCGLDPGYHPTLLGSVSGSTQHAAGEIARGTFGLSADLAVIARAWGNCSAEDLEQAERLDMFRLDDREQLRLEQEEREAIEEEKRGVKGA